MAGGRNYGLGIGRYGCVASMEENIVYRWVSTRYFMEKYRSDDISWRNIGPTIFRDLSQEIADCSRYINDFYLYIAWSTRVKESQTRYSAHQRATMLLQCPSHLLAAERI